MLPEKLLAHHGVRQQFGSVGHFDAGCALQKIFFLCRSKKYIIALFTQENVLQKIGFCVAVTSCLPHKHRIFSPDQIQNKVALTL